MLSKLTFTFLTYYRLSTFKQTGSLRVKINLINSYNYLLFLKFIFRESKVSLFVISKNTHVITLLKAPMAHKTWSKEQVFIKYYFWTLTVRNLPQVRIPTNGISPTHRLLKSLITLNQNNLLYFYRLRFFISTHRFLR